MTKEAKEAIKAAIMTAARVVYPEREKAIKSIHFIKEAGRYGLNVSKIVLIAKEDLQKIDAILDGLQDSYDAVDEDA